MNNSFEWEKSARDSLKSVTIYSKSVWAAKSQKHGCNYTWHSFKNRPQIPFSSWILSPRNVCKFNIWCVFSFIMTGSNNVIYNTILMQRCSYDSQKYNSNTLKLQYSNDNIIFTFTTNIKIKIQYSLSLIRFGAFIGRASGVNFIVNLKIWNFHCYFIIGRINSRVNRSKPLIPAVQTGTQFDGSWFLYMRALIFKSIH